MNIIKRPLDLMDRIKSKNLSMAMVIYLEKFNSTWYCIVLTSEINFIVLLRIRYHETSYQDWEVYFYLV